MERHSGTITHILEPQCEQKLPSDALPHEWHLFFLIPNTKRGTKSSGRKKKKMPNGSRIAEIASEDTTATAVRGHPDHLMIEHLVPCQIKF